MREVFLVSPLLSMEVRVVATLVEKATTSKNEDFSSESVSTIQMDVSFPQGFSRVSRVGER